MKNTSFNFNEKFVAPVVKWFNEAPEGQALSKKYGSEKFIKKYSNFDAFAKVLKNIQKVKFRTTNEAYRDFFKSDAYRNIFNFGPSGFNKTKFGKVLYEVFFKQEIIKKLIISSNKYINDKEHKNNLLYDSFFKRIHRERLFGAEHGKVQKVLESILFKNRLVKYDNDKINTNSLLFVLYDATKKTLEYIKEKGREKRKLNLKKVIRTSDFFEVSELQVDCVLACAVVPAFHKIIVSARTRISKRDPDIITFLKAHTIIATLQVEFNDGYFAIEGKHFHSISIHIFIRVFITNLCSNNKGKIHLYLYKLNSGYENPIFVHISDLLGNFSEEFNLLSSSDQFIPILCPPLRWFIDPVEPLTHDGVSGGYLVNFTIVKNDGYKSWGNYSNKTFFRIHRSHVIHLKLYPKYTVGRQTNTKKDWSLFRSLNYVQSVPKVYPQDPLRLFVLWFNLFNLPEHSSWFKGRFGFIPQPISEHNNNNITDNPFINFCIKNYEIRVREYEKKPDRYKKLFKEPSVEDAVYESIKQIEKALRIHEQVWIIVTMNRYWPGAVYDVMRIDFRGRIYPRGAINLTELKYLRYYVKFSDHNDLIYIPNIGFHEGENKVIIQQVLKYRHKLSEQLEGDSLQLYAWAASPAGGRLSLESPDRRQLYSKEVWNRDLQLRIFANIVSSVYGSSKVKLLEDQIKLLTPLFKGVPGFCLKKNGQLHYRRSKNSRFILDDLTGVKVKYSGSYTLEIINKQAKVLFEVLCTGKVTLKNPEQLIAMLSRLEMGEMFTVTYDATCSGLQMLAVATGNLAFIKYVGLVVNKDDAAGPDFYCKLGEFFEERAVKFCKRTPIPARWYNAELNLFIDEFCKSRERVKAIVQPILYGAAAKKIGEIIVKEAGIQPDVASKFAEFVVREFRRFIQPIRKSITNLYSFHKKRYDVQAQKGDKNFRFVFDVPLGKMDISYIHTDQSIRFLGNSVDEGLKFFKPRVYSQVIHQHFDNEKVRLNWEEIYLKFFPNITHSMDAFVIHRTVTFLIKKKIPVYTIHDAFVVNVTDAFWLREAYINSLFELNDYYSEYAEKNGIEGFRKLTYDERDALWKFSSWFFSV